MHEQVHATGGMRRFALEDLPQAPFLQMMRPEAISLVDASDAVEIVGDRFELTREAGRGGMCVVFEARNRFTGRVVALKRLLPEFAHSVEARTRLLQEALALGVVQHPHVVDVLDAGEADGEAYVVMEMLCGRSLEGILAARTKLTLAETIIVARQSVGALAAVHSAGIVHRDVKPGNLLVMESQDSPERDLKLIDFGLARMPEVESSRKISRAATVIGTPEYMPLESLTASGVVHPQIDVYALGVTLYECLSGTVPFPGTYANVLCQAATCDAVPIVQHRPEVPPQLAAIIMKALSRNARDRYADAMEMRDAIEAFARASEGTKPAAPAAPRVETGRRYARVPFITPVRVKFEGGMLEGRSEDLSEAGLMVLLPTPLAEGTKVQIRFALPHTGEICACTAVVRWARGREARACAVGIELVEVAPRIRNFIAEYVKAGAV